MLRKGLVLLALVAGLQHAPAEAKRAETADAVWPLLIGASVPVVSGLIDAQGAAFDLHAALDKKPTVLVFYRGHW